MNTDAKGCGTAGRQYIKLDGKEYCTYFTQFNQAGRPSEDYFNVNVPGWGLGDRDAYYKNILDCILVSYGEDPEVDMGKEIGNYPKCYFPMGLQLDGAYDEAIWI